MREPIKPEDIREGDLIRRESKNRVTLRAVEYVARTDGHTHGLLEGSAHYDFFLLDRPKPAVDLPTEPTLGWAAFTFHFESEHGFGLPETQLGIWERKTFDNGNDTLRLVSSGHNVSPADGVTAFTPAVAVPGEALEALRAEQERARRTDSTNQRAAIRAFAINDFLTAVDNANEQATR